MTNRERRTTIGTMCFILMVFDLLAGNVTSAAILFVAGLYFIDKSCEKIT